MRRKKGKIVDGIINLDKPLGLSSNQALQQVKKVLNAQKAGHTGSLDPLASGVLPLCFGQATKVSSLILESNKRYHAGIFLGVRTTTGDKEGEEIGERNTTPIDIVLIQQVLKNFLGKQQQIPPMYSALKVNGQPLYKEARKGNEIERQPRDIEIPDIQLLEYSFPNLTIDVTCTKGTYIRTLAEDIGKAMGYGGHLFSLRRVEAGSFNIQNSIKLEALKQLVVDGSDYQNILAKVDSVLQHIVKIELDTTQTEDIKFGRKISFDSNKICFFEEKKAIDEGMQIRLYSNHQFLGLGLLFKPAESTIYLIKPQRLFC